MEQGNERFGIDVLGAAVHGGGEKGKVIIDGVMGGVFQLIAEFADIQEGEPAAVGHPKGNIQISQTHIAVHAQNPLA